MGKSLIVNWVTDTKACVEEFEQTNSRGQKVYSDLIIKYFTCIRYDHYVGLIIHRSEHTEAAVSFTQMLDTHRKNLLLEQIESMYSDEFTARLEKEKEIYFDEDKVFRFRASESMVYEVVGVRLYLR